MEMMAPVINGFFFKTKRRGRGSERKTEKRAS